MADTMRKGSHNFSVLQGKSKRCYFTDAETGALEKHHIYFGSGLRQISDKHGFWVWLKPEWHRGTQGVHGRDGHKIDLTLKRDCQRRFEQTHSREEFMAIVGRNYLDWRKKNSLLKTTMGFVCLQKRRKYEQSNLDGTADG